MYVAPETSKSAMQDVSILPLVLVLTRLKYVIQSTLDKIISSTDSAVYYTIARITGLSFIYIFIRVNILILTSNLHY